MKVIYEKRSDVFTFLHEFKFGHNFGSWQCPSTCYKDDTEEAHWLGIWDFGPSTIFFMFIFVKWAIVTININISTTFINLYILTKSECYSWIWCCSKKNCWFKNLLNIRWWFHKNLQWIQFQISVFFKI